jgi:succinate dehydrogenase / fumarate reductase iron-sulfur subunit
MQINGRVRQSCSALVDRLLAESGNEIVLEPMSKFPVIRDLMVDRQRLFRALTRVQAWVPVDSYYDMGPGERQSQAAQEQNYPLSQCMSCGCCLDACPQFTKVEVPRLDKESDEAYERRKLEIYDQSFVGPHAISQAMLCNNHPTGRSLASQRMDALIGPGGVQACGNAQNCVSVCPKEIPLTTSIARAGRAATVHMIKKWFEK